MPARVSYEPSLPALVAHVFPPPAEVWSDVRGLRHRVSWPALLRSTGLGRVDGGEIVLVPRGREGEVLGRLEELAQLGVSAVAVADPGDTPPEPPLPLVVAPAMDDVRRLREDIERYVGRRRRELFALDGEMHRLLVDPAIGGASAGRLLEAAHARARKTVLLDRDGEFFAAGPDVPDANDGRLIAARRAAREGGGAGAQTVWLDQILALPIEAGSTSHGVVLLMGTSAVSVDDDEVVLTALASGLAITLSRSQPDSAPDLETYLQRDAGADDGARAALVVSHASLNPSLIARALSAELAARGLDREVAVDGRDVIAALGVSSSPRAVVESLAVRLASPELRAGTGRPAHGPEGLRRSIAEGRQALQLGSDLLTTYESVELSALLLSMRDPARYVESQLGPLLGRPDLLETLAAFLLCGRRVGEAAERLHVHRNTVIYRIGRVRDLLEVDLHDGEACFRLELALRLHALLP